MSRPPPPPLNRNLGNVGVTSLPSQTNLNAALLNQSTFPGFTAAIEEGTLLHNSVHGWIGGEMGNPNTSPREPAFIFSHGFIDKTWQDWVNSNYTAMQTWVNSTGWTNPMPCGQGDINIIDPNTIWDSRALDIWYAYNNLVILDKHTVVTGPSKLYKYTTGVIQAENGFIVPAGADCTFEGSTNYEIAMLPGFGAEEGSEFSAIVQ